MDFSFVSGAATAIKTAIDIGRSALAVRDTVLIAGEVARMNDQLLQAQQSLFAHNTALLDLQQIHFETRDKLRIATEQLAEKGRYVLFQTGVGQFAYRVNLAPAFGGGGEPVLPEPLHYICQQCFDRVGEKVVLRFEDSDQTPALGCPACKAWVLADLVAGEIRSGFR